MPWRSTRVSASRSRRGERLTGLAFVLALTGLRLLLGPVLGLMALRGVAGAPAVGVALAAFGSDYFDGVLARRLGVDSAAVRRFDSATDTVFFLCAAWAAWHLHAAVIAPWLPLVWVIVALEAAREEGGALRLLRAEPAGKRGDPRVGHLQDPVVEMRLPGWGDGVRGGLPGPVQRVRHLGARDAELGAEALGGRGGAEKGED